MARVLVVEPSKAEAGRISKIFQSVKVPVEVAETFDAAFERIAKDPPALVVTGKPEKIESLNGLRVTLSAYAPATPFIVTLPRPQLEDALQIMRAGAFDCVASPYPSVQLLMAAKRATSQSGRMLFTRRLTPPKRHTLQIILTVLLLAGAGSYVNRVRNGPPPRMMSLGSANLSGIQWEGRSLWVADWFESTVTRYEISKGILPAFRKLETKDLYKVQDGQPILVCDTPDLLITIGSDLKIRIHQRGVGLPTFQTVAAPGTSPSGLAWDGSHLWTVDSQTHLLYKHGQDLRVIDTVKCIFPKPAGLSWDGTGLWVIGDKPLKAAKLEFVDGGLVWRGPVSIPTLLPEGVIPTGFAIAFGRLWAVSGGDPKMTSVPIPVLVGKETTKKLKAQKPAEEKNDNGK